MNSRDRRAGHSTREMADKRYKARVWFILPMVGVVLAIVAFLFYSRALGIGGLGFVVLFVVLVVVLRRIMAYTDVREKSMISGERRAIRGAEAEERIGSLLDTLGDDYLVANDVVSPHGNIDHVVMSKYGGISLIETKAHGGSVSAVNGRLLINGHEPEKDFIAQTLRNTYWLRDTIRKEINAETWITPIIVFTNAFVERTAPIKGVTIINRKYLLKELQRPNAKSPNLIVWESRERILKAMYARSGASV